MSGASQPRPRAVQPLAARPGKAKSFLEFMSHAAQEKDDKSASDRSPTPVSACNQDGEDTESGPAVPRPNFGDIMASWYKPDPIDDTFSPMERVVLSANGNLQRIISSFYNRPVTVKLLYNKPVPGEKGLYDREVEMDVGGVHFGGAVSKVKLDKPELVDAVEQRGVAIGQLFRHFKILPSFRLLSYKKDASGAFQRTYMLEGAGISCHIRESFVPNLFFLHNDTMHRRTTVDVCKAKLGDATGHFGDIMAGNRTGIDLPAFFEPPQRVLLTANGNFERVVSSFYETPASTRLISQQQNIIGSHDMVLETSLGSEVVMIAKVTVHLTDTKYIAAYDNGVELGELFHNFGILPTFELHNCGQISSYFWRSYSLSSEGMTWEVHETIDGGLCSMESPTSSSLATNRCSLYLARLSESITGIENIERLDQ